jgi:hypothetical protein
MRDVQAVAVYPFRVRSSSAIDADEKRKPTNSFSES